MTQTLRRGRLFLGSYALLFTLLAIRIDSTWVRAVCATLAVWGFADMLWIVFGITRRQSPEPILISTISDSGPEVAGYLATYLLPFLTVAQPSLNDVIAYTIFLGVTGLIYVRSEMTQVNPTLYILRRRVVRITTDAGWSGYVVARSELEKGQEVRTVSLDSRVRVEVTR